MEKDIKIPEGIETSVEGTKVKVKGKLGELERDFYNKGTANILKIDKSKDKIKVSSNIEAKKGKALIGTTIAHISNLFKGVSLGYKYKLKIVYIHFPISIERKGDELVIKNFLGQKGDKKIKVLQDVKVEINKDEITIEGINKELVGQMAASLESATRIKNKDRRRFQDGLFISEKGFGNI